jgi:hypothetical protein
MRVVVSVRGRPVVVAREVRAGGEGEGVDMIPKSKSKKVNRWRERFESGKK